MSKTRWQISISNIIIAGIFIYIGLWFLLENLGFMNTNIKNALISFIPYVLAIYGLMLLIWPLIRRKEIAGYWIFGLFFFPYGALLLVHNFGYGDFTWVDFWKLWPMIIIYVGSVILFHRKG